MDFTHPYLSRMRSYSPFFRGTTGIFRLLVPDMPVLTSFFEQSSSQNIARYHRLFDTQWPTWSIWYQTSNPGPNPGPLDILPPTTARTHHEPSHQAPQHLRPSAPPLLHLPLLPSLGPLRDEAAHRPHAGNGAASSPTDQHSARSSARVEPCSVRHLRDGGGLSPPHPHPLTTTRLHHDLSRLATPHRCPSLPGLSDGSRGHHQ